MRIQSVSRTSIACMLGAIVVAGCLPIGAVGAERGVLGEGFTATW